MGSFWRACKRLSLLASAAGGGTAAALIATSDDPATALKLCATVPHRLLRDAVTAANIAFGNLTVDQTESFVFPEVSLNSKNLINFIALFPSKLNSTS